MGAAAALIAVGAGWTAVTGTAAFLVRKRPVAVLGAAEARLEWRRVHRLVQPVDETSRVVSAYLSAMQKMARPLATAGLAPNALTAASIGPALVAAGLVGAGRGWAIAGGVVVLAVGLMDGIDGAVAVATRRATSLGEVLDAVVDCVVDIVLLVGPVVEARRRSVVAAAVAAGIALLLMEYVRTRAQVVDPAVGRITPAERPTRVIALGLGAIGRGTLSLAAVPALWYWPVVLWTLCGLCAVSAAVLLADARLLDSSDERTPERPPRGG